MPAATDERPRSLRVDDWPVADRLAWQTAITPGRGLRRGGRASHLKTVSQNDLARRYGGYLGFCMRQGDPMQSPCPAALVTEQGVEAYLEELQGRVGSVTMYGCIYKLRRVAEILDPDRCFKWLREIEAELDFVKRPKPKHHRIVTTDRLVDEGHRLFESAATLSATPLRRARTARNGLMIALLALCPIRLRSFAGLMLGETFVEIDGRWWIVLPPEETKSGRPDERPVPDLLSEPLRIWLEIYRPTFAWSGHALWPSGKGGALTPSAIERTICDATRAAFGHAVNPHLFRDCAVTTMAIHSGENMGTASALLQHADPRTTEAYYNKGRMVEAAMEFAELVNEWQRIEKLDVPR